MASYAAFISYAHRYGDWVSALQRNLERVLAAHGETRGVFLDTVDLGSGRSWIGQLEEHPDILAIHGGPRRSTHAKDGPAWARQRFTRP